jgi:hypothetical protein
LLAARKSPVRLALSARRKTLPTGRIRTFECGFVGAVSDREAFGAV